MNTRKHNNKVVSGVESLRVVKVAITIGLCLVILNLFIGGSVIFTLELAAAFGFGVLATLTYGPTSAFGVLTIILLAKYVVLGTILKALFWEPWDSNLVSASTTGFIIALGFLAIFVSSILSKVLRSAFPSGTKIVLQEGELGSAIAVTLGLVALAAKIISVYVPSGRGPILPFVGLWPAAVAFAAAGLVRKRSTYAYLILFLCIVFPSIQGLLAGSKEGMMFPLCTAILYVVIYYKGFNLKVALALYVVTLGFLVLVYPYSQMMKNDSNRGRGTEIFLEMLNDSSARGAQRTNSFGDIVRGDMNFMNVDVGILERLVLIKTTDRFVTYTDALGTTGWLTIANGLANLVPRAVTPGKEDFSVGNFYGQFGEVISKDDIITSVAPSLFGHYYNAFGTFGVFGGVLFLFVFLNAVSGKLLGMGNETGALVVATVMIFQHHISEATTTECVFSLLTIAYLAGILRVFSYLRYSETGLRAAQIPRTTAPSLSRGSFSARSR